tara:strand:- start:474 stop:1184 length:711 start_codon:yes stop_codon:yes gene_type:complete
MSEIRPRLSGQRLAAYNNITSNETRLLVVGDLHEPFCLDGYLDFCVDTYQKFNCNAVHFCGDLVDNHYASYHETSPDGFGGQHELEFAIQKVQLWSKAFKKATVCVGNHDRLIARRAFSSNIPKAWIKSYNEVLGTDWNWQPRFVIDDVQYVHGEGGTARTRAKNDMMSTVQGHIHTQSYTEWMVGNKFKIFGMQIGCGIDRTSYSMSYAREYKKQAIGCGVVIGGHTAINCLMDL